MNCNDLGHSRLPSWHSPPMAMVSVTPMMVDRAVVAPSMDKPVGSGVLKASLRNHYFWRL